LTQDEKVVLQSGGSSCVPAAVANILGTFGIHETEQALAREMGTTVWGTSHGRVALVLWQRGLRCRRVLARGVSELKPPAALTVDHPATGPESHMVALMAIDGAKLEIWDPVGGEDLYDCRRAGRDLARKGAASVALVYSACPW
jgi:hypothetical protein